jgi:hypothetical protein
VFAAVSMIGRFQETDRVCVGRPVKRKATERNSLVASARSSTSKRHRRFSADRGQLPTCASELLQDVFGKDKSPCRLVYGVASLPLGTPVELEIIFEVVG